MQQTFRQEEAEEILRAAVRRSMEQVGPATMTPTEISADRLKSMAAELGVEEETLQAILDERRAHERQEAERMSEAKLREIFIGQRRHEFVPHAIAYVLINAVLIYLNLISTRFPWAMFPIAGWGIGFVIHAWLCLPTRGPAFEASFDEWRRKRKKRSQESEDS